MYIYKYIYIWEKPCFRSGLLGCGDRGVKPTETNLPVLACGGRQVFIRTCASRPFVPDGVGGKAKACETDRASRKPKGGKVSWSLRMP